MASIIWLASYVKSGSTWFSFLFDKYFAETDSGQGPMRMNLVEYASVRKRFDRAAGIDSSLMTEDEIEELRPLFYKYRASSTEGPLFLKIHDACCAFKNGASLIPPEATKEVFYLMRNPLDVAVSSSHFFGESIDTSINFMNRDDAVLSNQEERLFAHFRVKLLSWSRHVESWVDAKELRVHPVRYEDLVSDSLAVFSSVLRLAGIEPEQERVERAVRETSFSRLQQLEKEYGFSQNLSSERTFFRKGKIGSWREELTIEQVRRIVHDHREVMRRFGYLDKNDEIVY
jgi:hypothetical protein